MLDSAHKRVQNDGDMDTYYIVKPGTDSPIGPLSVDDIRQKLQMGEITPDYYYSTPGAAEWKPVAQLPGLSDTGDAAMPPVPGAPVAYPVPMSTKPSNYLVWSCLGLLCCVPLAIYCIIKSASVNSLWEQGKYAEAKAASESAKNWNIANVIITIILCVISVFAEAGAAM